MASWPLNYWYLGAFPLKRTVLLATNRSACPEDHLLHSAIYLLLVFSLNYPTLVFSSPEVQQHLIL